MCSKRVLPNDLYIGQLNQSKNHACVRKEGLPDGHKIFCILVNERSLSNRLTQEVFATFLNDNKEVSAKYGIHYIPISILDLATALFFDHARGTILKLSPKKLKEIYLEISALAANTDIVLSEFWFTELLARYIDNAHEQELDMGR